jgi:hypothetical protein
MPPRCIWFPTIENTKSSIFPDKRLPLTLKVRLEGTKEMKGETSV